MEIKLIHVSTDITQMQLDIIFFSPFSLKGIVNTNELKC